MDSTQVVETTPVEQSFGFEEWLSTATDRELLQFNARKANDVVTILQGIHDGLAPMMEKVAPFLAGLGL